MSDIATTPFGRRSLSLGMVAAQIAARSCPPEAITHKWKVFQAICEAKTRLGVSDRTLAVLNALISFHPDTTLTGDGDLIVFPSNRHLSLRAHGMAPATLRRHLAVLVDVGLVIRRDSPNGKRYARKGEGGSIEDAFGFDLAPLVARGDEFEALAEATRQERRALMLLRERVTLYRRDIAKMIAAGLEEAIPGDWNGFHLTFRHQVQSLARQPTMAELEIAAAELAALAGEIRNVLESHLNSMNPSAKESQTERHIQNSNPDSISESELASEKAKVRAEILPVPNRNGEEVGHVSEAGRITPRLIAPARSAVRDEVPRGLSLGHPFPLGMVLDACPSILDYAPGGIASWKDLIATAQNVRGWLGISPSAWNEACEILGTEVAGTVICAVLQRGEAIKSAGGYVRSLTEKARAGKFSLGPMLMALLRSRHGKERRQA